MRSAPMLAVALVALLALPACSSSDKSMETSTSGSDANSEYSGQSAVGPGPDSAGVEGVETGALRMEGTRDFFMNRVGDTVLFGFDSAALSPSARETVKMQAEWMKAFPATTIMVEGHCDERGTREYNLALGARRATAVKNYLVALGVSSSRIKTISYGKERPAAAGSTESAYRQNRRGVSVLRNMPASN
ncbi:MAG: peptidoglycan-associated lipoprotein Pal [Alphaproteobacteria bacterium]